MAMASHKTYHIVIAGYYGFSNVGDEAVLESMIHDFRNVLPEVRLTVLSENPQQTSLCYEVEAVLWRDLELVISVLEKADLLVIGGGGLYNSYLDYKPEYFLNGRQSYFSVFIFSLPFLAYLMNKTCIIYAVGASYINSIEAKKHILKSINLATNITVRDPETKAIFESLGPQTRKIKVTADPAFRLINASQEKIDLIMSSKDIIPDRPLIGVVLRNWNFSISSKNWEKAIILGIRRFVIKHGGSTIMFPFQRTDDTPDNLSDDFTIIDRIQKGLNKLPHYILRDLYKSSEISGVIAKCDLIIGMRLHSVILAIKNAIPFLALPYDPKVYALLNMVGLNELALDLNTITVDNFLDKLEYIYKNTEQIKLQLQVISESMKDRAEENISLIMEAYNSSFNHGNNPLNDNSSAFLKQFAFNQTNNLAKLSKMKDILEKEVQIYRKVFRNLIDCGNYQMAINILDGFLAEDPNNAEWNYLMGFCQHMMGNSPEIILDYYDRAMQYGFDEFWVRYNRASCLINLGDFDTAKTDLERALSINPNHEGVLQLLKDIENRRNNHVS